MFKISCAKVALKSAYGTQIDGLTDCFIPTHEEVRSARNEPTYGPSTRLKEKHNLIMPPFLSAELRKMPSYRIPEIWNNEIPPNLRDMGSILYDSFKSQTLHDYSMFQCNNKNCYSCLKLAPAYITEQNTTLLTSTDFYPMELVLEWDPTLKALGRSYF